MEGGAGLEVGVVPTNPSEKVEEFGYVDQVYTGRGRDEGRADLEALGDEGEGEYSRAISHAIKEWNPRVAWKTKDLRNTILTWATVNKRLDDLWEQYVGHAPKSVTALHYVPRLGTVTTGDRHELDSAMDIFRRHVTGPIDHALAKLHEKKEVQDVR